MLYTAGNNSLTFNDKKGKEQIQISSEKDFTLTCKDANSMNQKTFKLTSTESTKLTQKTFELSADESVKIVAGKDGVGATLQMAQDGNLSIKIGPVVSFKISPSGEVTFTGTTEIKMMGNLEVIGNILATGNVHGTNI